MDKKKIKKKGIEIGKSQAWARGQQARGRRPRKRRESLCPPETIWPQQTSSLLANPSRVCTYTFILIIIFRLHLPVVIPAPLIRPQSGPEPPLRRSRPT